MHVRIVRRAVRSAAVAAAVTGTLTWAPAATAQPATPAPSASTASAASAATPAPDAGSVAITAKSPAGDGLQGASFLLLDATGQEAGRGKTDAQGKLTFLNLAPGVYRLKETASGSPLHDVVADQDVIVTPGATVPVTITDPFKAAQVQLTAKDDKTGRLLPGATMAIGTGETTVLTLTTGANGTASGELPVSSGKQEFWSRRSRPPRATTCTSRRRHSPPRPGPRSP
ncbi:MSCRAMM family protein [Streptomyces sp. NPDC001393]